MTLILLQVMSLVYIIILSIFYFSKKRISTIENKIYKYLLIANIFGLIIELGCFYTVSHLDQMPVLNKIITKTLLVYYLLFIFIYTYYVFIISFKESSKFSKNKLKIYCVMAFIMTSILICYLPMEYFNNGTYVYSYGASVNCLAFILLIVMTIWIIVLIKNIKNTKSHKYLPVFAFIILAGIAGVIQKIYPQILLTTPIETFIIFLMYFTIENPDKKMLDEVHKAKVISDNANEEKTLFLYNMTNEIRGITKDIDKEADNILDETDNKKVDIEVISDSAREIKGSTARFTSMTNEILDISSVDSASVKVYNEKYNIKILLKELVQIYKKQATDKGLDFRVSIASDMPEYLYGDNISLKKALTIILDNSIKYTNSGYVEFNVNAIIKNDIARLIISIEDSGIGMKAEDLNKIFIKKQGKEENYNLNNNLYNAKRLITLMNGAIVPTSSYGSGTTIKVILDQKYEDNNTSLNKYDNIYDKKKILLIDDSPTSEKLLNKVLSGTNVEVDSVKSGKEGLEKIRNKEKYDLILLDEELEPQDGHIIMQKLLIIRNFNTKVILLTRDNKYEYDDEYLHEGFTDYIIKSSSKEEILNKINKYLK